MTSTRLGLALVVAMTASSVAHADLASGRDKLIAGDYKVAIAELGKVTGKDRPAARRLLARAQLATGDYAGAEATLAPLAQGPARDPAAIEAHLVFDQLRRNTSIVIVEHNLDLVLALADRVFALERGAVFHQGPAAPLLTDLEYRKKILWL